MAIVLLFTALLQSGCLGVCCCVAVLLGWEGRWFVAIVHYLQHLCCAAALVCALCCCVAKVMGGGGAWRLCYYLQHSCCPADLVWCCVAVLLGWEGAVHSDCATIYSTSAVLLPWCVAVFAVLLGLGGGGSCGSC